MLAERVLDTPVAGPGLLGEIEAVLAAGGVRLAEVSAFAVGLGPGAFTSLRVGLATVKGLAYATARNHLIRLAEGLPLPYSLRLRINTGDAVIIKKDGDPYYQEEPKQ